MRKMITLVAAAALAASPFAFAEDQTTTGNPNDVLQTVPGQMADSTPTPVTTPGDATAGPEEQPAAAPMKKHHHKHHHHVVHHHHHHHHHTTAAAPSSDTHETHEEANSPSGNDMSAPAAH
jgi:hypothetical protein